MELRGQAAVELLRSVVLLIQSFNLGTDHLRFLPNQNGKGWKTLLIFHRKSDILIDVVYDGKGLVVEAFEYKVIVGELDFRIAIEKEDTEIQFAGIIFREVILLEVILLESATRLARVRLKEDDEALRAIISGRFRKAI